MVYSISSVLAVAKKHSFYDQNVTYPPDLDAVENIVKQSAVDEKANELSSWPLLYKKSLYTTVERLINDTSPQNTYRRSVYAGVTGGGRGSKPLFFAADVHENRRQRAEYGQLLASSGILSTGDWVVTMHSAGGLYRALDLTLEIVECAGACALAAGNYMPMPDVLQLLIKYQANVIAGDSSQIVNLVNHLSELPQDQRDKIHLDKILYTSEVLTAAQRLHIRSSLAEMSLWNASTVLVTWVLPKASGLQTPTTLSADPVAKEVFERQPVLSVLFYWVDLVHFPDGIDKGHSAFFLIIYHTQWV
ncbi:hypothetical protein NQ176_g8877 [Zarea fungicola]|uniref:Uncharacterized protein n=1 Tax=Zarea fungicola TaxID=93591 RepID=A0ACC1MRR9_9HYPO|nr:hypothetical protein NQ176_g8877 [Lecanicillium fungicola]